MPDPEHSINGARAAAARGDLDTWVADFLASPGSDNEPLAYKLTKELTAWTGPVLLPLDQLHRLAGPPGDPVVVPVDENYWDDRVDEMELMVEEGEELSPVIVAYRGDELVLEDGNHRVESLRQAGHGHAWAVVGFEHADDRDRFAERLSFQS